VEVNETREFDATASTDALFVMLRCMIDDFRELS
jgi:hypothetical protein